MLYSLLRLGSLTRDLNASTFRKTALGLTAAAAMIGLGAVGFSPRASAQEITLNTDCNKYRPGELGQDALCEVQRDKLLDKERSLEAQLKQCIQVLQGLKTKSPAEFAKLGKITRENACELAGRVPRPTASLN